MAHRQRRGSVRFAPALLFTFAVANPSAGVIAATFSADRSTSYEISAQDLGAALNAFGIRAGLQLTYTNDLVAGLKNSPLDGVYTVESALSRLLAGTGLTWRYLNDRAIILERQIAAVSPKLAPAPPRDLNTARSARRREVNENRSSIEFALEVLVVTGSRISRNGYQAPTPLAVLDVTTNQASSTTNVADFVNTMPIFAGSSTPAATSVNVSQGTSGVNALNLRGLGTGRTVVLLDGQRSVGAFLTGAVDINSFPQQLIQRVEVVTGGASAVYGSDAVGGVANFILDKTFEGIKADASAGITSYGDDKNYRLALSAGFPFGGGRGHILLSGEEVDKEGVVNGSGGVGRRPWMGAGWTIIRTPGYSYVTGAGGGPELLVRDRVDLSVATHGGIIISGPLSGTAFGPGGVPYQFTYGELSDGRNMQGGDWKSVATREDRGNSLDPSESRQNLFVRAAYDITDNTNLFGQLSWAHTGTRAMCCSQFSVGNLVVKSDNAFLRREISPQQSALLSQVDSMVLGTMHYDLPPDFGQNDRIVSRYVFGGLGTFDVFAVPWKWDAYYQYGISRNSLNAPDIFSRSRLAEASDAVVSPVSGLIVCRSTLDAPNNGCVPYNLFGTGVNSGAAVDYLTGLSHLSQTLKQEVWAASVTGEPFTNWAGPVSLALNFEHRAESVSGASDPASQVSDWLSGNYRPTRGSYEVTEGALETVVPLASQRNWAKSWDLQAAARFTGYSVSGFAVTWKVGTTYAPVPDIKLRLTRSRDIRAPNLQELFAGGTAGSTGVFDPFTNATPTALGLATGNLQLNPEKADTVGVGAVVQPYFIPNFSASVDYWDIRIKDAIGSLARQQQIDLCFKGGVGSALFCEGITRNASGTIIQVATKPFNLAINRASGFDFEASYHLQASDLVESWRGSLSLQASATTYLENFSNNGVDEPTDTAGENAAANPPKWRYRATFAYEDDSLKASLTGRGVNSGVYSNSYIECTSACPLSTGTHRTIDNNRINGALYWDAAVSYGVEIQGFRTSEMYLNVKNLANKSPPVVAPLGTGSSFWTPLSNPNLYDLLGRVFRVGVRFRN